MTEKKVKTASGTSGKKFGISFKEALKILGYAILSFVTYSVLWVLVYKWLPVPGTSLMLIRSLEKRDDGKKFELRHEWVPLENISPYLQLAVVASEDQTFLRHFGISMTAIEKAREDNEKGKRIRGGSTITQQTAKNVFLWPSRNYLRKALEVWFTLLMEIFWSKESIMEVYLNSIEMGDGIFGAEAASKAYFGKSAKYLSREEAALIAAILPNPRRYSAKKPGAYVQARQQFILRQMNNLGGKLDYGKRENSDEKKKPDKKKRNPGK